MKQKTAIRKLIELLEMRIGMRVSNSPSGYYDALIWTLENAKRYEPLNEQHIKEAYLFGNHSEIKIGNPQIEAANIYFNETFEKP